MREGREVGSRQHHVSLEREAGAAWQGRRALGGGWAGQAAPSGLRSTAKGYVQSS